LVKSAWTRQFTDTGYFKYYCKNHPDMTGLIIVK
jgi:plastocyanin